MPTTPENGQYLVAAYAVAAIIYLGYTLSLFGRASRKLANPTARPPAETPSTR